MYAYVCVEGMYMCVHSEVCVWWEVCNWWWGVGVDCLVDMCAWLYVCECGSSGPRACINVSSGVCIMVCKGMRAT